MKKWLLGITCMLMMLGLIFSAGCGRQPASPAADRLEVRNSGTAIQWKYSDENDWHDLVSLDELRGAAGENGKDGPTARTVSTVRTASMAGTEPMEKTARTE